MPGSDAAQGYVDAIRSAKSKGHRYTDVGDYNIKDFTVGKPDIANYQSAVFTLTHGGLTEIDADGGVVQKIEGEPVSVHMQFSREDGRWLVAKQEFL